MEEDIQEVDNLIMSSDTQTIDGGTLTQTAIYSWASPSAYVTGANFDSALLKAYFDYTTSTD